MNFNNKFTITEYNLYKNQIVLKRNSKYEMIIVGIVKNLLENLILLCSKSELLTSLQCFLSYSFAFYTLKLQ